MRLAIFSPSVLPVPAVDGGAVEELITYIIEENELQHKYDIDIYTVDNDDKLKNFKYKHTNIISIKYQKNVVKEKFYAQLNKVLIRLPKGRIVSNFSEELVKKYKQNYYDAVLIEDNRYVFNAIIPKLNHEKIFFHIHDDVILPSDDVHGISRILHPAEYNMIRGIIKSSDKIITVSDFLKHRFEKCDADNAVTLYNGIEGSQLHNITEEKKRQLMRQLSISDKDFVITFIGRFTNDKGLDKLLSALKLLADHKSLKCLIVGKNWLHSPTENAYQKKLHNIIKSMPKSVKNRIIFTGYVNHSDINKIYSLSNCVIIPSQVEEAFGVVALEAMTMGVPVIASNSGGLPEVLGNNAIIVNRGKNFISDLAEAIKVLYSNPELIKKISVREKARSRQFPQSKIEYFDNFCKIVK